MFFTSHISRSKILTWYLHLYSRSRNNQHVLSTDRYRPYNTRNRSSLAIRQLTFDDAGNYSAESEDSYGTSLLASIDLNVQKRKPEIPVFLRRLHDISVKIGSRARFLVEIESLSPLKVCTTVFNYDFLFFNYGETFFRSISTIKKMNDIFTYSFY